jgi:hypothetical protein
MVTFNVSEHPLRQASPRSIRLRLVAGASLIGLATACGGDAPPIDRAESPSGNGQAAFTAWLASSPISPLKAIALVRVDSTVSLGPPSADIPLDGIELTRLVPGRGAYSVDTGGERRTVPLHRPFTIGDFTVLIVGSSSQDVVTVFGQTVHGQTAFYPPDPRWSLEVVLQRDKKHSMRMLALDGV